MKKRIYLLKHAYVDTWQYVGATSEKYININLNKKWCDRHRSNTLLYKAFRCSQRSDWSIEQLHDFTEDWERLEAEYIAKYDSFHNGLNSTASGAWEYTHKLQKIASSMGKKYGKINGPINAKKALSKPVLCSNGLTYLSVGEASRQTGISKGNISSCLSGNRKTAGSLTWHYLN